MSVAWHCDLDSCNAWVRPGLLSGDWATVYVGDVLVAHCCCLDHVMQWAAARSEPNETVQL